MMRSANVNGTNRSPLSSGVNHDGIGIPSHLRFGFLTLVVLTCLWPRYFFLSIGGVGINPYTIGMLVASFVAFMLLVFNSGVQRRWISAIGNSRVLVSLLVGYTVWRFVSAATGTIPAMSLSLCVRETLYIALLFFPASVFFLHKRCVDSLTGLLVTCLIVSGLVGLYEWYSGVTAVGQLGLLQRAAGDLNQLNSIVSPKFREGVIRAQAFFSHPIVFGQFSAAMMPIALAALSVQKFSLRSWAVVALFVAPLAVLSTQTRSALIVAIAALLAWYLIRTLARRKFGTVRALTSLVTLVAVCTFLILSVNFFASLVTGRTETEVGSTLARAEMTERGIYAISNSPFLGYGAGQAPIIAGLYGSGDMLTIDNLYLSEGIDGGLVGVGLLIGLILATFILGFRLAQAKVQGQIRALVIGMSAMVLALAVGQSVLSISDNLTFIYLAAGLFVALNAGPMPNVGAKSAETISHRER